MNAYAYACGELWALDAPTLEIILAIASRDADLEPLLVAAKQARATDGKPRGMRTRDDARNVAIVPVRGVVMRYGNVFSELCDNGATSTDSVAHAIKAAVDDPAINAILLEIDSPGGQASGIAELAGMVRTASKSKPVVAYVSDKGASAAYWIAAAADEIVVAETAILGSIGAVLGVSTKQDKNTLEFVSSVSPNKRPDMSSESGRSEMQARVDALGQVFVEHVAAYRGVSVDTVLSDFGGGSVLMGKSAVSAGLADRLGTFESVLSDLARGNVSRGRMTAKAGATGARADSHNPEGDSPMFGWKFKANDDGTMTAAPITEKPAVADAALVVTPVAVASSDAEVADLRKQLATAKLDTITATATGWYDSLFASNKIVPAEKDSALASFIQASVDDLSHPLPEGKKRTDTIKATFDARTGHTLDRESLDATADAPANPTLPAGYKAVDHKTADPNKKPTEARVAELVGHLVAAGMVGPNVLAKS